MRALRLVALLAAATAALGSGCMPTESRYLRDHHGSQVYHLERLDAWECTERKPALTADDYQQLLTEIGGLPGPIEQYQSRLKEELQAMTPESKKVLDASDLLAFPAAYNDHLRIYGLAHLGLSRRQSEQSQWKQALDSAQQTVAAGEKALTPVTMAELAAAGHTELEAIYRKRGAAGKAMLAKFNVDLLNEYLASPQGLTDYYMEKQLKSDLLDQIWETDSYIIRVNMNRLQEHLDKMDHMIVALSAVSASVNTMAANQAAARGNSGSAMSYRFNASLADFTLAATQAKMAGQKVGLDSFLNSFAMPMLSAQLADPKMGANVPQIIKDFASDAAKADPALAGAAGEVAKGVNDIVAVRGKGNQKKTQDAVGQFAEVLTQFQAKVQEIGAQAQ